MDETLVNGIKSNLDAKSTEELSHMWESNNLVENSPEALEAARRTLLERDVPLPEQIPFTESRREEAEKSQPRTKSPHRFRGPTIVVLLGMFWFGSWNTLRHYVSDGGEERVVLDVIAVCIVAALFLTAGLWYRASRKPAE